MIAPAKERVQNGVAFLDIMVPDWRERINVKWLNISTIHQCVLGQLYGDYFEGKRALDLYKPHTPNADDLGFVAKINGDEDIVKIREDVHALNAEWKRVLTHA